MGLGILTALAYVLSLILRGHPFDRACTKGWRLSYAAAGNYWCRHQPDLSRRAGPARQPDLTAASRIGDSNAAEGSKSGSSAYNALQ